MKSPFSYLKEEKCFLALDIGTEAVKALIFKKENEKITILGASLQYFDRFGVFNSEDFEMDIIKKAISKTIKEAKNQASKEPKNLILGLPADILKARTTIQSLFRKNPERVIDKKEEKRIFEQVLTKAKKEISQKFAKEYGILPENLYFISQKVLEIKINGYEVPSLLDFGGKTLDFRILATFLPRHYLKNIEKISQALGFKTTKIVHEAEGLIFYLREKPNGIFLDIGGEITQIFLVWNGKLELVNEFKMGGKTFSQGLSESLGLESLRARVLKQEYSKGLLSKDVGKRIKEIFSQDAQAWFSNLKSKILDQKLLPPDIFLFGGGCLLPENQEILEKGNWQGLSFTTRPQVKFIYPEDLVGRWVGRSPEDLVGPEDLKGIEDKTKSLNNPQETPSLLICLCS